MLNVVAIEKRSSLAFLETVFDTHDRREIAFPVDRLGEAAPDGIHIVRWVECQEGGGWFSRQAEPLEGNEPAQIALTSGTTGTPKPILLSRGALGDVTHRLIEAMGLTSEVREYVGIPVTYSFGFGRVRAVTAVGGSCFLPEQGFRVDEFARMLSRGEVNALSAVPTLLRVLIDQKSVIGDAGTALRWLEIGSQPMSAAEKETVRAIFPNARIVQHYGLTEASRSTFLDISRADAAALKSVGSPNGAVEVRITKDKLIAIRGPHLATGMVTAEGVVPLADEDGWLVTRDLGRLDQRKLMFEGRIDHLVNVGGVKVSAETFEAQLVAALPAGMAVAVAGGQDPIRGQTIVIAHLDTLSEAGRIALHEAAETVAIRNHIAGAFALFPIRAIPVTDTGKVRRGEITQSFDEAAARAPARPASAESNLIEIYARALNRRHIAPDQSFASLGGDSLGYIEAQFGIFKLLGYLPDQWETLPIREIEQLAAARPDAAPPRFAMIETEALIRPLAMTTIVASHAIAEMAGLKATAEYWKGGAVALLMTAGYNLCRFQKGVLLSDDRLAVPATYLRRLVLPFYVIILYKCLQWAHGGPYVAWSTFALLDDYIRYPGASAFTVYWFIGVLFQCVLLCTALFYVRPVREFARRSGFNFGLALFILFCATKAAVYLYLLPVGAVMFPNNQFDAWAYAFALGWMVAEARTGRERLACILLGILVASISWGGLNLHTIMLAGAMLLILYVPRTLLPIALNAPLALWARATFFIYISHGFAMAATRSPKVQALLAHSEPAIVGATIFLSTIGGILFYLVWRQVERLPGLIRHTLGRRAASGDISSPALTTYV